MPSRIWMEQARNRTAIQAYAREHNVSLSVEARDSGPREHMKPDGDSAPCAAPVGPVSRGKLNHI